MSEFFKSALLLLVLLNPFLVIIYLIDVVQKVELKKFIKVLLRAALISIIVFCFFALLGDKIFQDFVQAEFASFQIFGGIIFLLIGIKFVFKGPNAIEILRGDSENLASAIAMPILIGPGTISYSILIGKRLAPIPACLAIIFSVAVSAIIMILLKMTHDYVKPRHEILIQKYIDITGRITALFVGTIALDMIMQGIRSWINKL